MKRFLLFLLIFLFAVSNVSADRISPTNKLGLFIDVDAFISAVWQSRLDDYVTGLDYGETNVGIVGIPDSFYINLHLINKIEMYCFINDYGKISSISLNFPATKYSKSSNEVYTILGYVIKCSGLLYSEYDKAISTLRSNYEYINDSYGVSIIESGRYSTEEIDVTIYDSYWFSSWKETPYSRMKEYYDNCDTNYVGACVPVTNKNMDCKDIEVRNFFVIGQDNHYFDGDMNGVCCEPYPLL